MVSLKLEVGLFLIGMKLLNSLVGNVDRVSVGITDNGGCYTMAG